MIKFDPEIQRGKNKNNIDLEIYIYIYVHIYIYILWCVCLRKICRAHHKDSFEFLQHNKTQNNSCFMPAEAVLDQ